MSKSNVLIFDYAQRRGPLEVLFDFLSIIADNPNIKRTYLSRRASIPSARTNSILEYTIHKGFVSVHLAGSRDDNNIKLHRDQYKITSKGLDFIRLFNRVYDVIDLDEYYKVGEKR